MRLRNSITAVAFLVAAGAIGTNRLESQTQRLPPVEAPPLELKFVKIPPGEFTMGCSPEDTLCSDDERPAHRVRITKPFELGTHEVTQTQYLTVTAKPPDPDKVTMLPAVAISWNDAQGFISRLNDRKDGFRYRLPTEAEWEYAARAGTTAAIPDNAADIAWYNKNARSQTHPVGAKKPNPWGLYDMFGNVFEWVQDWYGEEYYNVTPASDPTGPAMGRARVTRGGSWIYDPEFLRVSVRFFNVPGLRYADQGFRVAREPVSP